MNYFILKIEQEKFIPDFIHNALRKQYSLNFYSISFTSEGNVLFAMKVEVKMSRRNCGMIKICETIDVILYTHTYVTS